MQFLSRDGTLSQPGQPTEHRDSVGVASAWRAVTKRTVDDLLAHVQGCTWAILAPAHTAARGQPATTQNVGSSNTFVVCCS